MREARRRRLHRSGVPGTQPPSRTSGLRAPARRERPRDPASPKADLRPPAGVGGSGAPQRRRAGTTRTAQDPPSAPPSTGQAQNAPSGRPPSGRQTPASQVGTGFKFPTTMGWSDPPHPVITATAIPAPAVRSGRALERRLRDFASIGSSWSTKLGTRLRISSPHWDPRWRRLNKTGQSRADSRRKYRRSTAPRLIRSVPGHDGAVLDVAAYAPPRAEDASQTCTGHDRSGRRGSLRICLAR